MLDYQDISPPIACRLKMTPTSENIGILQEAKAALHMFMETQSHECIMKMAEENRLLERILYKKAGQLRSCKSQQCLRQLHRSLKRLFEVNPPAPVADLLQDFQNAVLEEGIPVYLPSRQTTEYVLVHLMRLQEEQELPRDILPAEVGGTSIMNQAEEDELTLLLEASSQTGAASDSDEEQVLPAFRKTSETTHSGVLLEDLGDPVSVSDIEMGDEDLTPDLETASVNWKQTVHLPHEGKQQMTTAQLMERIQKAPTIRDLQLLLKRCRQILPSTSITKQKKCAMSLTSLQARSQMAERSKNIAAGQKLLSQGRKKLLQLLKSAKPKPLKGAENGENLWHAEGSSKKPSRQKKSKRGKLSRTTAAENSHGQRDEHTLHDTTTETAVCSGSPSYTDSPKKGKRTPKVNSSQHTDEVDETGEESTNKQVSLLSTKQQLVKIVRSVKRKQQFKLKGSLFELQEPEAAELLPHLQSIRSKLKTVKTKEEGDTLLVKATKRLWKAVRCRQALRSQWKLMKRKALC
ncbi:hypothetical protein BaRGS_00028407 [Batillaria attramentaria]|uniref:Nucleolus and neural progenitor protein-like N-terminal domain-containing protein n=1 Tax=Batillaria attramentaria TaxID=370345 RepID=A0ABD0K037_9CAEN